MRLSILRSVIAFAPQDQSELVQRAKLAAFASSTYDVLTDWKGMSLDNQRLLKLILLDMFLHVFATLQLNSMIRN